MPTESPQLIKFHNFCLNIRECLVWYAIVRRYSLFVYSPSINQYLYSEVFVLVWCIDVSLVGT